MTSINLPATITLNVDGTFTVVSTTPPTNTAPTPPGNVKAVAGVNQATVSFTTPSSNGGSPITGYKVTASTGQTSSATTTPITLTGLAAGVPVTFTAQAINAIGTSAPSAPTAAVTPTAPVVPPTPTTGWDGVIAISSTGKFVNGSGTPFQPRGINMAGLESQLYGGWWNSNPWGSLAGAGGPPWPTVQTWKANIVRIPLSPELFFNLSMGVLTGTPTAPVWSATTSVADPLGVYKSTLIQAIQDARASKCYIIFDLHWSAPAYTFNGVTHYLGGFGQPMFMNYDTDLPFWTAGNGQGPVDATGKPTSGFVSWLQQNFGPGGQYYNPAIGGTTGIGDMVFELFNEPFLDGQTVNKNTASGGTGTSLTNEQVMLNGGWVSGFSNQYSNTVPPGVGMPNSLCGPSGQPNTTTDAYTFNYWWRAVGYQQVLNGIRALGATNVILVNGLTWSSKQSTINQVYPKDTLAVPQVGTGFHIYESGPNTGFPGTGDAGSGTAQAYQFANATMAGTGGIGFPIPVLVTEYGNSNNLGSGPGAPQPDPYMVNVQAWMDAQPVGSVGGTAWAWAPVASYGNTTIQSWIETVYTAPFTFTASISGNVMTVTQVAAGSTINPGCVIMVNGQFVDRSYVRSQLSGTTGGVGTYQVSIPQTLAAMQLTGQYIVPNNGQGQTHHDWMVNHT